MPRHSKPKSISFKRGESLRSEDNVEVDLEHFKTTEDATLECNYSKATKQKEKYSFNYRIVKTALLIFTWISFGLNFEMIGSTMEDLKIFLDVNYSKYSFGLVLRNSGYLAFTLSLGLCMDRITNYSDILIAVASLFIGITNFLTPVTRSYFFSMSYYLLQGMCQAVYDVTGNYIILDLWSEINASPINSVHGGYGIGAMLATQIAKPFIRFDPLTEHQMNIGLVKNSTKTDQHKIALSNKNLSSIISVSPQEPVIIDLRAPYWIAGSISTVLAFLFLIAQTYQAKNRLHNTTGKNDFFILNNEDSDHETKTHIVNHAALDEDDDMENKPSKFNYLMQKLMFTNKIYEGKPLFYMLTQTFLFILVFVMTQGAITIITRFMLTYLTKGPANLDIKAYSIIFTLFWGMFICSRFVSTYISLKIESIIFFFIILISNSFLCMLFLVPFLVKYEIFFWICIPILGLLQGPIMPLGLMVAKKALDFNSFVLSLLIMSMALGGMVSQQITGELLDHFRIGSHWMGFNDPNTSFIIPHLLFIYSFSSLIIFLPIFFLFRNFDQLNTFKIQI